MALAATPFRTLLDKKTQRRFTVEMKPYGVNGSTFSKFFDSYVKDQLEEKLEKCNNDEALTTLLFDNWLYGTCRAVRNWEERRVARAVLGQKLFEYFRIAAKAKQVVDRKEALDASINGKLNIDELKEMFPNIYFERNYFRGKPGNYKLYLRKNFNIETKTADHRCFSQYMYLVNKPYYDPAEIIEGIQKLIKDQSAFYEKQLADLMNQTNYVNTLKED